MKVRNLTEDSKIYTSNVYLVTGSWNTLQDVNTLLDVGRDVSILDKIKQASTGIGKPKVEQIVLTHSHYDHAELLKAIKTEYPAITVAFSKALPGVDRYVMGGETLRIGDALFEVIHAPGHSNDSICLYCPEQQILFAGDTPLVIHTDEGSYTDAFIQVVRRLANLPLQTIYFGHGPPLRGDCNRVLRNTLQHITKQDDKEGSSS